MLTKTIPGRVSACQDCGVEVRSTTCPKKLCDPCALERKRATARRVMTKQRVKRGIAPVKGTEAACATCSRTIVRRNIAHRFCKPCGAAYQAEAARRTSRAKQATAEGREYNNAWARDRRRTDPAWGISAHMRVMVHRALGTRKQGRSWREFVPYSLEDLMRHIERQFLPGMTWANRGKWHIDHIQPLSGFSFTSPDDADFRAAWALTNLRPLWGADNIRKQAKRTHLL
jgi:hypothetical protein